MLRAMTRSGVAQLCDGIIRAPLWAGMLLFYLTSLRGAKRGCVCAAATKQSNPAMDKLLMRLLILLAGQSPAYY
jgi:hypothetical protein